MKTKFEVDKEYHKTVAFNYDVYFEIIKEFQNKEVVFLFCENDLTVESPDLFKFVDDKKAKRLKRYMTLFVIAIMIPSIIVFYGLVKKTFWSVIRLLVLQKPIFTKQKKMRLHLSAVRYRWSPPRAHC